MHVDGAGNLGTNLGGVNYWDGVVPFANLMDQAGDWVPQAEGASWGKGPALTLNDHGWPSKLGAGQFASAVLAEVTYPPGIYRVRWRGTGTFDINGTQFGGAGSGGGGSVKLDGSTSVVLNLRTTDPNDPIRAIDVRVPGEGAESVFRASYLVSHRIYRALRFMDWQRTNSVPGDPERVVSCATRIDDAHYSQGTSLGASVERMVDLANALDADPWFNIPHEATDDWVTCHARVVASQLEPGLTPRYEFSNETWNPVFRAYRDLAVGAQSEGLGSDEFEGIQLLVGRRHVHAMSLVQAVFDAAGRRFTRVMAGQAANVWVLETRLSARGARAATDEIAIAPYLMLRSNPFDAAAARSLADKTPDDVVQMLADALDKDVSAWLDEHRRLSKRVGLPLVAYEGGQHLVGDPAETRLTQLFIRANRAEGMAALYRRYLGEWAAKTGNQLFMHFSDLGPATQYGSWGALEAWSLTTSPKYRELVRFATTPIR